MIKLNKLFKIRFEGGTGKELGKSSSNTCSFTRCIRALDLSQPPSNTLHKIIEIGFCFQLREPPLFSFGKALLLYYHFKAKFRVNDGYLA